jgi:hypothetical protein
VHCLDCQLPFRSSLGITQIEPSFDPTTFDKNRGRLLEHAVEQRLFDEVVGQAQEQGLLSDEHFTVDGTLIQAYASLKSGRRGDGDPAPPPDDPGNPPADFHGERRSNTTRQSMPDPGTGLVRKGKGKEAKLSFTGHALMENRNGLLVDYQVDYQLTPAMGTANGTRYPTCWTQRRNGASTPIPWAAPSTTARWSAWLTIESGASRHTWRRTPAARGQRDRRAANTPPRLCRQPAHP